MISEKGFLLSYLKYGDNNAILHIFTQENGFESFFVKGIYTSKNKKKAYLQPLNELNLTFATNHKPGSIKNISKLDAVSVSDFYRDIKTNTIVFFVADFLNHILRNEAQNKPIYSEIFKLKQQLEAENYNCHLIFLLNILKLQGLSPLNGNGQFLDAESGTFKPQQTHQLFDENISKIWKDFSNTKENYNLRIDKTSRKPLLESLLVYYHYHFSEFRTPKSLEIIQQIFE